MASSSLILDIYSKFGPWFWVCFMSPVPLSLSPELCCLSRSGPWWCLCVLGILRWGFPLVSLGHLLYVPLSPGQHRLGGTALAQCFSQLGEHPPDLDLPENLVRAFRITQGLLKGEWAWYFVADLWQAMSS